MIGINPVSDSPAVLARLCHLLDDLIARHAIPTQACVLTHATTTIGLIESGVPVDLVFQSIAGTEAANASFGVTLGLLGEAQDAGLSLKRGTVGRNVMYFETGQGSALSAGAHHGVDQQTLEVRAYGGRARVPTRCWSTRSWASSARNTCLTASRSSAPALEDHFCGKLHRPAAGRATSATPTMPRRMQDDMDTLPDAAGRRRASRTSWASRARTT